MKKLLVIVLLVALIAGCCGCKKEETTAVKRDRLQKEIDEGWEKVRESQKEVDSLERLLGK